jgi:hypothetical protein
MISMLGKDARKVTFRNFFLLCSSGESRHLQLYIVLETLFDKVADLPGWDLACRAAASVQ